MIARPLLLLLGPYQRLLLAVEQLVSSSKAPILGVTKCRGLMRQTGGVNSILRACEEQRCQRSPGEMIMLEGMWYWQQICAHQTVPSESKTTMAQESLGLYCRAHNFPSDSVFPGCNLSSCKRKIASRLPTELVVVLLLLQKSNFHEGSNNPEQPL